MENDMLDKEEELDVHNTRWQDPMVLEYWGLVEDLNHFTSQTGLFEFARHPQETYADLSREFLATFRFDYQKVKVSKKCKGKESTFNVKFVMKDKIFVTYLDELCNTIFQMMVVGEKFLVILMLILELSEAPLVWMFLMRFMRVNFHIFRTLGLDTLHCLSFWDF
jgi:hypothetical protein